MAEKGVKTFDLTRIILISLRAAVVDLPGEALVGVDDILDVDPHDLRPPVDVNLVREPVALEAGVTILKLHVLTCREKVSGLGIYS